MVESISQIERVGTNLNKYLTFMIDRVCGIYLLCHTLDWSQIKFSAVRKKERVRGEIEEQIGLCNSKIQDDTLLYLGERKG